MKKMTGLPKQDRSCSILHAATCCKVYIVKVKYCLCCMIVIMFFIPSLYSKDQPDHSNASKIFEAYELRISGKAEKAEELLNELLKKDSTDALAYFELARTKYHLFLGGAQYSSEKWEEVTNSIQKAVRLAPDNEIYAFYYAYACFFNSFISMMEQNPDVGKNVTQTCDAFKAVLKLNPDCHESLLYLVDIYATLPENMGGDKEKARIYAAELNKKDKLFGAMANARFLPDTADYVSYWQNVGKEAGKSAQFSEELGRAYLLKSDTENGTKHFQDAMNTDRNRSYLYMHLARYHILSSQQNMETQAGHLEQAEKMANSYLLSSPELTSPLKAYGYGIMALIKMIGKDDNGRDEYQKKAESIDPYYSRATGIPPDMLYCQPDKVKIQYYSFFMPF
jgi:hypothetical protein